MEMGEQSQQKKPIDKTMIQQESVELEMETAEKRKPREMRAINPVYKS